ncbi:FIG01269488: protein, clustered with ribosomal protein L32p [hydrothermal vent metagenome]|uniref:FIG01269488: protein, clustered with ribosomal protein L32p n=1 Tax=hydrothermal vent metagenome TaxID=652676 RepID=A0A3B1DB39_9ZZZZ
MKVLIKDIHPGGIEIIQDVSADIVDKTEGEQIKFTTPFEVKAKLKKTEGSILADIDVTGEYHSVCARCLENINESWHEDFFVSIPIERNTEFVELEDSIRQEIFLNLPARTLCTETCKGLCPDCGINLNNESCKNKS